MSAAALYMPPLKINRNDALLTMIWLLLVLVAICWKVPTVFMWTMIGSISLVGRHYANALRGASSDGALAIAVLFPILSLVDDAVLVQLHKLTPITYDWLLLRLDLGVAAFVRGLVAHSPLMPLIELVYVTLPLMMLFVIAISNGAERKRLLISAITASMLAVPCYLILPAVGPVHVGDPAAPGNCMPSMHLTWALLLWINTRGRARWLTATFAFLTAVATLATGEHYLPDLLAAVPWAWTINRLTQKLCDRH